MNKVVEPIFTTRPTVTLELPLGKNTRIMHPEQVILKIGSSYHDLGSLCYAVRSEKQRSPGQPQEVVLTSLIKQRPKQIAQAIKALSGLGQRPATVSDYASKLKSYIDWADANGLLDCLAGGEATQNAYRAWATFTTDRYRCHEFGAGHHNLCLRYPRTLLETMTGVTDLGRGIRTVKHRGNINGGTEPAGTHNFAHALALNQAMFDGLCDLILNDKHFPFKLDLPASLGWEHNFLWLFPTNVWRLPPHLWGTARKDRGKPFWAVNYEHGRLASFEEIQHNYLSSHAAKQSIRHAQASLDAANGDPRHWARVNLGSIALGAFMFLFIANTGCNDSVARELETNGQIDVSTLNQKYRSIKFRAHSKMISLITPANFMPALRKFMELRRYLLNDKAFPYVFFTLGPKYYPHPPAQVPRLRLSGHYATLRSIDPQLPNIGSRRIRATVKDYYHRMHDASITAKIMGTTEDTEIKSYTAGSPIDHHEDFTIFLTKVSETAKKQKVAKAGTVLANGRLLEEGGQCSSFGHPESMAKDVPVKPDCKQGHGCLFCTHRILVAGEGDARKVASAAFVMEQVILGPLHEAELRPLIRKCDDDLEKIASFENCRPMVERVKNDVYQNGNLTPYFADKYQLFLELGVVA